MALIRKALHAMAPAMICIAAPALAQDHAEGLWFGELAVDAATTLTIVVEVTRGEDGSLTGSLDSPDQNAFGMPLSDLVARDDLLSFLLPAIGARYEGKWDPAGEKWIGTFFQAGQSWPLELTAGRQEDRPTPIALPSDWSIPDDDAIAAVLDDRIAGRAGAGIVAGILEQDEDGPRLRFVARGPNNDAGFDADTVFEIGSMTKVFTALILADMALAGEVSLDDPVAKYLPEGASMPTRGGKQITLRQLSHQTSGLPRLPDNMPYGDPENPYADYTEELLLEFLGQYELTRDIGSEYEYSNLGVGLLGYVLARAAGTDYESLVRARILDPLGMHDTAIALTDSMEARFAKPHDAYMRVAKPWDIPVIGGAGALRSNARDMLTFLAATLDPDSPIGEAMQLTVSERYGTENGPQYGLGWMLAGAPSGMAYHHGGGTGGFRTHMALQPEHQRAVVVLTNAAIEPSVSDIAMHLIAGLPVANETPVPPPPAPVPEREEIALSSAQLDHVVGTYQLAPGVTVEVVRPSDAEHDGVTAQLSGQPAFPIFASSPLEFFWKVVDARLVFTEEAGEVTGATLFQNGREFPLTRIEP